MDGRTTKTPRARQTTNYPRDTERRFPPPLRNIAEIPNWHWTGQAQWEHGAGRERVSE